MDVCYRFSLIGKPVCRFLKRHSTPEFFALIGNSPFEAFFAKISGSATKAVSKPLGVAICVGFGADYIASTFGFHQAGQHIIQDHLNGEKTRFKANPSLNKTSLLDAMFSSSSGFGKK